MSTMGTNWRNIGNAPGLSGPPDPEPSIFDDIRLVEEALSDAGIPDYLCEALAEVASRNWTPEAWADQLRHVYRHVDPIIEKAERDAAEARRYGDEP
jgi:hypothetical protein